MRGAPSELAAGLFSGLSQGLGRRQDAELGGVVRHEVEHEGVAAHEAVAAHLGALVDEPEVEAARVVGDAQLVLVLHVALLAAPGVLGDLVLVGVDAVAPLEVRRLLREGLATVVARLGVAGGAHRGQDHVLPVGDLVARVHAHGAGGGIRIRTPDPRLQVMGRAAVEGGGVPEALAGHAVAHGAGDPVHCSGVLEQRRHGARRVPHQAVVVVGGGGVAAQAEGLHLRALQGPVCFPELDLPGHLRAPVGIEERLGHHRPLPQPMGRAVRAVRAGESRGVRALVVAAGAALRELEDVRPSLLIAILQGRESEEWDDEQRQLHGPDCTGSQVGRKGETLIGLAGRPSGLVCDQRPRAARTRSFTEVMGTAPLPSRSPSTGIDESQMGPSTGSSGISPWLPLISEASSGITSIR